MNGPREWALWFVLLVGSVFVLGFVAGDALGAPTPPAFHVGPPATSPGVSCSRVTLRDALRGRVLVLEFCYRTSPALAPGLRPPSGGIVCPLLRPCPVAS